MEKGFRKGKIPQRFDGMTDEQIMSMSAQYSTDSWIEEVGNQIFGYINHYFDTELAAVQIIKKIERLEKALDKACDLISEAVNQDCSIFDEVIKENYLWRTERHEWKEWCMKDD